MELNHSDKDETTFRFKPSSNADAKEISAETEVFDGRPRSASRISYEAQVAVIQRQIGNLAEIPIKLGLSQRKICQLLLVDPSAWSRWSKDRSAPPHIWRALQWYFIINDKIPGLSPGYFLGKDTTHLIENAVKGLSRERQTQEAKISQLEGYLENKLRDELALIRKENQNLHQKIEFQEIKFNKLHKKFLLSCGILFFLAVFMFFKLKT